ncbi:hypothetical protein V8C42DRAFT_333516 [Trichoderma barbatum]
MSTSPPSSMISKWSSKSPKQKTTRIRNNQRRHRAKIKAHISSLEAELTETRRQLIAAEGRIRALTTEVECLQNEARRESVLVSGALVEHSFNSSMLHTALETTCCGLSDSQRQLGNSSSCERNAAANLPFDVLAIPNSILKNNRRPLSGIHTDNDTKNDGSTLDFAFVAHYDCHDFPPPRPDESTTSCIAAYGIIRQQNFRGVDMEAIHKWLQSGYRRATRPEDGCTVVNSLLYSLINHLSPV